MREDTRRMGRSRAFRRYARERVVALAGALLLAGLPGLLPAFNPQEGDFSREEPADLRLLTYNLWYNFIHDSSRDEAFARILQAVDPDIIFFQEVHTDVAWWQVANRLDALLPNPDGAGWEVQVGIPTVNMRNAVASRHPFGDRRTDTDPPSATRGVVMGMVDLPGDVYPDNLYVMCVHWKSGSQDRDEELRQRHADAIAYWFGEAQRPGGPISLPANTPMVVAGDFNIYGATEPEATLMTGQIQDTETFGPPVRGDWDGFNLTDAIPLDPFTGNPNTWRSSDSQPGSRLDRFVYTGSVIESANSFVLNTLNMSNDQLHAAGLQRDDTTTDGTSDHLPVVADFRFVADEWTESLHFDGPASIPDDDPGGLQLAFDMAGHGTISDVGLDLFISHEWVGDLVVELIHEPTGTRTSLLSRPGLVESPPRSCSGSDLLVRLRDRGIRPANAECQPYSPTMNGTLRPVEPFSRFNGLNAHGTWTLRVEDQFGTLPGTVEFATLHLATQEVAGPELWKVY